MADHDLDQNQITAVYEDVLFRDPDSGGLTFWTGVLDSGLLNLQQIISIFQTSTEAETVVDPVIRLYDGLFGRVPDQGGLMYWVGQQEQHGVSFNSIVESFLGSQEFATDYNGGVVGPIPAANNAFFVTVLYENMLGRAPDPTGLLYWVNLLGHTPTLQSEAVVVEGILNSAEFVADTQNGIQAWEMTGLLSALAGTTDSTVGTAIFPNYITNTAQIVDLTSGLDTVVSGLTADGTLGPGGTLQAGDTVANVKNLILIDDYGQGTDIIPLGATLSNIQNVELVTNGNAGVDSGTWFNVSGITNLQSLSVQTEGQAVDLVQAGALTNVTIVHDNSGDAVSGSGSGGDYGGGVEAIGGHDVTISNNGGWGVIVGNDSGGGIPVNGDMPTGAVTVTQNASLSGNVEIFGGTDITVTATSDSYAGDIEIGNTGYNTGNFVSGGDVNPTGAILVNDAGEWGGDITTPNNAEIDIFGGTTVTVNAAGEEIVVGDSYNTALGGTNNPSGEVTITNTAPYVWGDPEFGGQEEDVWVAGGAQGADGYAVSVTTNTGDVYIGDYDEVLNAAGTAALAGTQPAGNVVVVDTAIESTAGGGGSGDESDSEEDCCCYNWCGPVSCVEVDIYGGVNVTVLATDAWVYIGDVTENSVGTPVVLAPIGNINITDVAPFALGDPAGNTAEANIYVIGGANIDITTNVGNVTVGSCDLNAAGTAVLTAAEPTGSVTVTDDSMFVGSKVKILGGNGVTVTTTGASVEIGKVVDGSNGDIVVAPTGDITVTDVAANAFDNIINTCSADVTIDGTYTDSTITVTTNAGGVYIDADTGPINASSTTTIVVEDDATGLWVNPCFQSAECTPDVEIYGGGNVTVTVNDATVIVGGGSEDPTSNPAGDVHVTVNGIQTANQFDNSVHVGGGVNVVIDVTGVADYCGDDAIDVGSATYFDSDTNTVEPGSSVTGTVTITDTHSGWNWGAEDITVIGGTTVDIASGLIDCCSCSTIQVGSCPETNAGGIVYINFADDPTGNVTIDQSVTYGSTTFYGEAFDAVFMNGGDTATLIGGCGAIVEDVQSTMILNGNDEGSVNGTSHLATVNLTGVEGDVTIISNALTTLNLTDEPVTYGGVVEISIENTLQTSGLTINLDNAFASIDDEGNSDSLFPGATIGGTVTVNSTGSGPSGISLDMERATSLVINNSGFLGIADSDMDAVTSITASGSGFLLLGDLTDSSFPESSSFGSLKSVTVTGTGGVYVEIDPLFGAGDSNTSFTGSTATGAAADEVVIDNNPATTGTGHATVTGGSSTSDVIYANFTGGILGTPTTVNVSGFETLGVVNAGTGYWNATGFSGLVVGIYNYYSVDDFSEDSYYGVNGNVWFENVAQGTQLTILDSNDNQVHYHLAAAFTDPGTVNVQIGQDANPAAYVTATDGVETSLYIGVTGSTHGDPNVGTVAIDSQGVGSNDISLHLESTAFTTIDITGDASLTLSTASDDNTVTTIDAHLNTGKYVDVTGVYLADATITGGSGEIIATTEQAGTAGTDFDTFNIGGSGLVTVGGGGAGDQIGQDDATLANNGQEIVQSAADKGVTGVQDLSATTIVLPQFPIVGNTTDGVGVIINNWLQGTITNGDLANTLIVGATDLQSSPTPEVAPQVLGNLSNVSGTTTSDHYNIVDGVASLSAPDLTITGSQEVMDVQEILDNQHPTDGTVVMVQAAVTGPGYTQGTFVIMYNGGGSKDTIVEITGLTGVTGFGVTTDPMNPTDPVNIGAGTSVNLGTEDYTYLFANVSKDNAGSLTGAIYNDAGFSLDTIENSFIGTNEYDNLANWALLEVNIGGTLAGGNVTVTQVGADPILTMVVNTEASFGTVTVDATTTTSDPTFVIYAPETNLTINNLVDPGSHVGISGGGLDNYVAIGAITDANLTTVDASTYEGTLYLGTDSEGGLPGPLTQTGLTIDVSTVAPGCGAFVFASGDGDTIHVGSVAGLTSGNVMNMGDVVIQTFNGQGDDILVNIYGTMCGCGSDQGALVGASGANDHLTLVGGDGCNPCFDTNSDGTVEGVIAVAGDKDSAFDLAYDTLINVGVSGSDCGAALPLTIPGDTSLGANETIQIGDPAGCNPDTTAIVWLGQNNVVTISEASSCASTTADLWVTGDTTGATIADSATDLTGVNHETINWDGHSNLNLFFMNEQSEGLAGCSWAQSVVNEATATSLGNAVNIAANQALVLDQEFGGGHTSVVNGAIDLNAGSGAIDWFQYGGNTYILEVNNSGTTAATHAGLQAGDVLIEMTGLFNPCDTGIGTIGVNHANACCIVAPV